MRRLIYLTPLAVLILLTIHFLIGLDRNPQTLPSAVINTQVEEFELAAIEGKTKGFSSSDLRGQVALVNIFGSWCIACREEHPFLMELAINNVIPIFGINWREANRQNGPTWLKRFGNPYVLVGDDPRSRGAIAFGVTGAPETFVIDKKGVIRFRYTGPLSEKVWLKELLPIIKELRKQ